MTRTATPPLAFMSGGGDTGALMRSRDWRDTALGAPEKWPEPLKTLVGVMLGSPQPMFIAWGPERVMLYNDGYAEVCRDRHPAALGSRFADVWYDIIADVMPILDKAYAGEATHMDDMQFSMIRDGRRQETHFAFSYTPVRDDQGAVAGVLCICTETTKQVLAGRNIWESEERLRLAASAAQIGTWDFDLASGLGQWDEASMIICGVLDGQHIYTQTSWLESVHPDDRAAVMAAFETSLAPDGPPYEIEFRGATPEDDGGERWLTSLGAVLREPVTNKPIRAVGIVRNITARKRAEAALASSEARFRSIFEQANDFIFTADLDQRITSCNPSAASALGYRPEEIIGRSIEEFIDPEELHRTKAMLARKPRSGDSTRYEVVVRARNGQRRTWEINSVLTASSDGTPSGFHVLARDMTEARAAAERLRASEERLRLALDSARMGTWEIDIATGMGKWSPITMEIYGTDRAVMGREERAKFIHPDDRERVLDAVKASHETGRFFCEYRTVRPDGRTRWLLSFGNIFRNGSGKAVRAIGTVQDITERRQAADALRDSEERLRHLNDELQDRVAEAVSEREAALQQLHEAQKLETLGQLTGGVAHDFNNLLTPIVGSLDLLRRRLSADPKAERLVDGALQAADRAKILVSRLLAFGRRQVLQPRPVEVAELLRGMTDLIRRSIGYNINVVVEPAPVLPTTRVDPNQLELAILNLAVNARDAMPGGGTLTITAHPEVIARRNEQGLVPGRYVRLSVIDTGTGMDEATLKRAIEPFFTTKGVGKGTGLGLSMIHGLAGQMGGALKLSSTVGIGTRVDLWLPVVETCAEEKEGATAEPVRQPTHTATILLVDDDELVRVGTADMLYDLGYEVIEAGSGVDALAILESNRAIDVLVTDYLMPGMNGGELIRAARKLQPKLPALIITGYATFEGTELDVPVLTKPFRHAELANRLAALIETNTNIVPFSRTVETAG